jgi:hypothetical protein
VAKGL